MRKLERKPGSHKGQNGRVGIIAGSKDYTGAPAIAGKAALRSGCDLAKILTSSVVSDTVASYSENFIVSGYDADYFGPAALEQAEELAGWCDALAVGPGMGDVEVEALESFLSGVDVPVVVDADAIQPAMQADVSNMVFTPHRKEAEIIEQEYISLRDFADRGAVVVQKGPVDRIFSGQRYENTTGTPAMTVGGTGDALAGIIASFLSQGLARTDAARLGAWVNGKAGEKAAEEYGNGMLATDMIEKIPEVLRG